MAEIGVLELQIRDNAKDAGTGLKSLADALYKVKAQTENKIGLSKVGTELNALAKQINGTQSNTPTIIKNITSLMNSLTGFSKIKSLHIDTKSIDSLKNAVSGFNIGNAGSQMRSLQQAISGNWDTNGFAQAAGTIVSAGNIFDSNGTASKLSTVTSALTKFTKAYKDLPNSTKKMENVLGNFAVTDYKSEYEAAAERAREAFERSGRHGIAFDPQQFGGKGSGRRKSVLKAEQMQMDLDQIGTSVTEKYSDVETTIESTTRGIEDLNIRLHETKDTITSIVETVSAMQNSSLSIIPYSGGGGTYDQMFQHRAVAQENMLSTYVDYSKQFAPNWKEADTNINATDAAVQNLRDHMGDMNSYLENSTTYADHLAQSLGNMGHGGSIILYNEKYYDNMMDKAKEYWEYNRDTAENVMLSTRRSSEEYWKPDFAMAGGRQDWSHLKENAIPVEGNVSEEIVFSSIEEAARAMGITVDEAKQKLQETYNMVYGNGSGSTVFSSIEEAAKAMGITVDEAKQKLQETYDMVYGGAAAEVQTESAPIIDVDQFLKTYSHLDYLEQKYDHLKGKLAEKLAMGSIISKDTIDKDVQTLHKIEAEIAKIKEAEAKPSATASLVDVDEYIKSYSHIDYLKGKLEELKASLATKVSLGAVDKAGIDRDVQAIKKLQDEIDKLSEAEAKAKSFTGQLENAWSTLKSGMQKMFPTLSGLLKRFGSLVKYRALRAVIKHIADGFKEGWENLKNYKQAIGDDFANSVNNANAQLLTMKNSIGAAVAPAFLALLPILNSIVSAVITVINWVNQLISLLTGKSTWTRATEASAESLDNVKKSAGGASSAVKDLLADWDELNIIQSESGGGGGGGGSGAASEFENMFEEVGSFDKKITDIVDFIKDNFETIKTLAEGIGLAILAWKVSNAFGKKLDLLHTLSLTAGITLSIAGIKRVSKTGYDIGQGDMSSDAIFSAVAGVIETAIGGGLTGLAFGGITGGMIGLTVGAVVGLVVLFNGIDQGSRDALYGDIKLTSEEIAEEVNGLFMLDVEATLADAKVNHESLVNARKTIEKDISSMSANYVTFQLRADTDSAEDLAESVKKTVDDAKQILEHYQKEISIGFGFDVNYEDPKLVQKFSTENITGLEGYITDLGNQIGKILEDGVVDGIDEQNLLDSLMSKLNNVTMAIATGKAAANFETDLGAGNYGRDWTQVDRQGIIEYAKQYNDAVEKVREAAYTSAKDTKASLGGIWAGMKQREADNPGTYTKEQLQQAFDNYNNYNVEKTVEDFVAAATESGRQTFTENVLAALKGAAGKKKGFSAAIGQNALKSTNLMEWFQQNLGTNLGWGNYGDATNKEFVKTMKLTGISGWDMLADDIKKQYIGSIVRKLGQSSDTYKRIASELQVPLQEILTISKDGWDRMGEQERKRFVQYLEDAYGKDYVRQVLESSGFASVQEQVEKDFQAPLAGTPVEWPEETTEAQNTRGALDRVESTVGSTADTMNGWYDGFSAKMDEHDQTIAELQRKTEELKRKISGGDGEEEVSIEDLGVKGPIIAEVQGQLDEDSLYAQAKEAIEAAMSDGTIDTDEMFELQDSFGQDLYNQIVNELGLDGFQINGGVRNYNPATVTASAGVSDVGFSSYAPVATGAEEITVEDSNVEVEFNTEEMSTGVQSGTREGFANVVSALNALLTALNNKNFSVNINASSDLGLTNKRSNQLASNVTGEVMNA